MAISTFSEEAEDSVGKRVGVGVSSSDGSVTVSPSVTQTGRIDLDALWSLEAAKDSILV
jgi:hypothetical protein